MREFNNWLTLRKYNNFPATYGWAYPDNVVRGLSSLTAGITPYNAAYFEYSVYSQIQTLINQLWKIETVLAPVAGKRPYKATTGPDGSNPYGLGNDFDEITNYFGCQPSNLPDASNTPTNLPFKTVYEILVDFADRLESLETP